MDRFRICKENPLGVYDSWAEVVYHVEPHSQKKDEKGNIVDYGGLAEAKHLCELLNSLHNRAERTEALYETSDESDPV